MCVQTLAVSGATPRPLLYQGAPLKLPYRLLTPPTRVFSSILKSPRQKLHIANGLTLVTPNLQGWEAFPMPGALTHTRSLGLSHQRRHKSQVSLWGPLCAHGVSDTPHGKVRDNYCLNST